MAYVINQIDESTGEDSSSQVQYERKYRIVSDTTVEESDVLGYLDTYLTANNLRMIGTVPKSTVRVESTDSSTNKCWEATVVWSRSRGKSGSRTTDFPKQDPGIITETFNVSEDKRIARYARSTTTYTRTGYTASTFGNLIGQHGEGVEVSEPAYTFQLQRRFDYSSVTDSVKQNWASLVGCVNNAVFRGFPAGTVKFFGVDGRTVVEYDGTIINIGTEQAPNWVQKADVYFDVTFCFRCKPNVANYDCCGITCTSKGGWDHVWVETAKIDDANSGRTIDWPIAAHVCSVCPTADFSVFLA